MTLADLHEVAAARLAGWNAWVESRNTMDEEDAPGGASEVHFSSSPVLPSCVALP